MGQGDYTLLEFANRISNVEEKYAKEVQNIVECFCNSRLDLPAKKLEDIGKARLKTAKHLKKAVDPKKKDEINLWKVCNIYSATAVDVDEAMREVRNCLRKRLKPVQSRDVSAFRRILDDYKPANKRIAEAPQEIYDTNKPTLKEKQRFLDMFKRDKKEEKTKIPLHDAEQSYTQHLVDNVKASLREERRSIIPPEPPAVCPISQPMIQEEFTKLERPHVLQPQPITEESRARSASNDKQNVRVSLIESDYGVVRMRQGDKPVAAPRKSVPRAQSVVQPQNYRRPKCAAPSPPLITKSSMDLTKIQEEPTPRLPPTHLPPKPKITPDRIISPTMIVVDHQEEVTICKPAVPVKPSSEVLNMDRRSNGVLASRHSIKIASEDSKPMVERSQSMHPAYFVPQITNGRIHRFQPESQPARPRLQATMIVSTGDDEDHVIDRL